MEKKRLASVHAGLPSLRTAAPARARRSSGRVAFAVLHPSPAP